MLTSDDIALRVIDKLQLTKAPEFSGDAKPGLLDLLMSSLPMSKQASSGTPQERMLDSFRKRLLVYAADKSRVLVVEFWAYDPELAQNISNALVDEYLALTKQAKLEAEFRRRLAGSGPRSTTCAPRCARPKPRSPNFAASPIC